MFACKNECFWPEAVEQNWATTASWDSQLQIILTTLLQIPTCCISTWMKLFHDPSVNQFEKCFRLDCSRLIIQMHIHSDYFMPADYVISAAERELFMNACTIFVFPCLFSCRYLYIIVNICLFVAVCMRLYVDTSTAALLLPLFLFFKYSNLQRKSSSCQSCH